MDKKNPRRPVIPAVCLVLALVTPATAGVSFHYSAQSDNRVFYDSAISGAPGYRAGLSIISGGIISHHLLTSREMAGFFLAVKDQNAMREKKVRTIVIIGPDHNRRVMAPLVSSTRPWKTPGGFVHADGELIASLSGEKGVEIDDDAVSNDHSITSLIGFIGVVLPDVKVLPLLVGTALTWDGARDFGKRLARHFGRGIMVLVSTDFVHDRPSAEAARLDGMSRRSIGDPAGSLTVQAMRGITCDCRKGVLMLFSFLAETGMLRYRVLEHTDSGRITGLDIPVTTYFFVLYGD